MHDALNTALAVPRPFFALLCLALIASSWHSFRFAKKSKIHFQLAFYIFYRFYFYYHHNHHHHRMKIDPTNTERIVRVYFLREFQRLERSL